MKKFLTFVGCVALAAASLQVLTPVRRAEAYAYNTIRTLSKGSPQLPTLGALPQGGDGLCVSPLTLAGNRSSGADVEVTFLGAAPAYYRTAASYGAADGGYPTTKGHNNPPGSGDGGYASVGGDNYLPAATPVRFHLPGTDDSICAVSVDGGSLLVSIVNP